MAAIGDYTREAYKAGAQLTRLKLVALRDTSLPIEQRQRLAAVLAEAEENFSHTIEDLMELNYAVHDTD